MSKLIRILIGLLVIILLLVGGGLFALSPRESIIKYDTGNFKSSSDYLVSKFKSSLSSSISSKQKNLILSFNQDELSQLLTLLYNEGKNIKELAAIEGFQARLAGNKGYLYVNTKLYGIVTTQYAFDVAVKGEDNKIILNVEKTSMGMIPVSTKTVLNKLRIFESGDFNIDPDNQKITINYRMPEQLKIVNAEIKEGKLQVDIQIQIKSLNDLIEILKTFVTGNMSFNFEGSFTDVLEKYNGAISSGSMTLSQIKEMMVLLGIK